MPILANCGISDSTIIGLKKKGLIVPKKVKPVKRAFRTTSEDWIYYAADKFTPPLSQKEKELYSKNPKKFCKDLLDGANFFSEFSGILFETISCINKLFIPERLAGYLIVLRLFAACSDYNYYKYDRHLEYTDHKQSPVGKIYLRLKKLCIFSAKKRKEKNSGRWASLKLLDLISTSLDGRIGMSVEYSSTCSEMRKDIEEKLSIDDKPDLNLLEKTLKKRAPSIYKNLVRKSMYFRKTPTEILIDVFSNSYPSNPQKKHIENKEKALQAYEEIINGLNQKKQKEFKWLVQAIDEFIICQQQEFFIFDGLTPQRKSHLLDTFFVTFTNIKQIIKDNPNLVQSRYKQKMNKILVGNPIVAARKLLHIGENYFISKVLDKYYEELKRWL